MPSWLGGGSDDMRDYRLQVGGREPDDNKIRDFEKRLEGKEWKGTKAKRTGWRQHQSGNLDEAINLYREALAANEKDVEAMTYLGRAYRDQGSLYKSTTILVRAIKTDPDYAEAHSQLGITFDMQGNYAQAEQEHRRSVELDGEKSEYLNNLGFCYFLQGRTNDAVAELRKAINVNPDDKKAHNNLAYIYAAQGRFDQAFAELRRAGTEAEAYNNLGYLYFLKGDREQAIENYNRALQLNYSLKAAQDNMKAATSYGETPPPAPGFDTSGPSPVRVEPPLEGGGDLYGLTDAHGGAVRLFEEPGRGALIAIEPDSGPPVREPGALDAAGAALTNPAQGPPPAARSLVEELPAPVASPVPAIAAPDSSPPAPAAASATAASLAGEDASPPEPTVAEDAAATPEPAAEAAPRALSYTEGIAGSAAGSTGAEEKPVAPADNKGVESAIPAAEAPAEVPMAQVDAPDVTTAAPGLEGAGDHAEGEAKDDRADETAAEQDGLPAGRPSAGP
ncbi:MAG: tetratricopeptide repeat protein [Deltaproteobacteria bacterium]|nr:tetratricopeptide repeat protein [Deltaproteobacteria bacterium]